MEADNKDKSVFYAMQLAGHLHLAPDVKFWLQGAEVVKTNLQFEVKALERALALARVDVELADKYILLHRSLVGARKSLPVEIWADIFHQAVDKEYKPYQCTWPIAHTCRAWRAVIVGDSSFWKNCDLRSVTWEGSWAEENQSVDDDGEFRPRRGLRSLDAIDNFLEQAPSPARLDITLDFSDRLDKAVLERVVQRKNDWESVKIIGPELCTPRHKMHDQISLLGNMPSLRRVELCAFDISLRNQAMWQGNALTSEDLLPWFQGASHLTTLCLEAALEPENTLDLAWSNITLYTEVSTRRLHVNSIPIAHLMHMTNLRILHLKSTWLPDASNGPLTLQNLETLSLYYPVPRHPIPPRTNYDRLIALCVPNLKILKVDGRDLGFQFVTGLAVRIDIAACVLNLLGRSGSSCLLAVLTIGLNTGLTDKSAIMLLCGIPSLREFKVTQDYADEAGHGILTPRFFAKFSTVVWSVETFIAQGSNGLKVQRGDQWVADFISMLEFQFEHNLQKVDVRSSRVLSGFCPFTPQMHLQVDTLIHSLKDQGKEVWVHCAEASHEWPAGWGRNPSIFDVFNSEDDYSEPTVSQGSDSDSTQSDEADSIFSSDTSTSG